MSVFPDIFPYNYLPEDLGERSKFVHSELSVKAGYCITKELKKKSFLELKRFCSVLNLLCLRIVYDALNIYYPVIEENEYEDFIGIFSEQARKLHEEFRIDELEDWDTIVFLYDKVDNILAERDICHGSYELCSEETDCDTVEL